MTPNIPGRYRVDLPAPDLPVGNGANDSSDELSEHSSDELSEHSSDELSEHSSDELSEHSSDELELASSDNSILSLNYVICEGFISLSSETRSNIVIRDHTSSTTVDAEMFYQKPHDSLTKKCHTINKNDENQNQNEDILYHRQWDRMSGSTPLTTSPNEEQDDISRVADISSYQGRLQTFSEWSNHSIDTTKLARAGFYFTGSGDLVRCFLCGGGLHRWREEDDPWNKHYKAFGKHCLHR